MNDIMNNTIGEVIKQLRIKNKYTQKTLALGVTEKQTVIKEYKKSNVVLLLVGLLIGIIANFIILIDYEIHSGPNILNLIVRPTFIGVFTTVIALGIGIYLV